MSQALATVEIGFENDLVFLRQRARRIAGLLGFDQMDQARVVAALLDLIMPDMSGFEMLDRLGSDPATHGIPVLVITSKVLTDAEQRRLSRAVAILSKASSSRQDAIARLKGALAEAEASRRRPAAQGAPNVH